MSYWRGEKSVDVDYHQAFGRWKIGLYQGGFSYRFVRLDSLYRQSFAELDNACLWRYGGLGIAYGVSTEWLDDGAFWNRHHYSLGALGRYRDISLKVWAEGFVGESPLWLSSIFFSPVEQLSLFAETSGKWVLLGYSLSYSFVRLESMFRGPGFAVALGVSFSLGGWNVGGSRGFSGQELGWNGLWFSRSIVK